MKLKKEVNLYRLILSLVIFIFYIPFFKQGMIVFSDIAVGTDTQRYLEEILGLWNNRFNTTTLLNLPRLFIVLPSYLLSLVAGAEWLTKSFVILMTLIAGFSQFHFTEKILTRYVHLKPEKTIVYICSLFAGIFYALNPWFILRIQHTYLLCGYSLFPLIIHYYLKIFNKKYANNESSYKNYILFATLLSIGSAAIHYFFFCIISLSILIFSGLAKKLKTGSKSAIHLFFVELKKSFWMGFASLFSCFYWLGPYLYATATGKMTKQANINVEDTLMMFSKESSLWNVVSQKSYWWPMFPKDQFWGYNNLGWVFLLILIGTGVTKYFKKNDLIKLFSMISFLVIILATGTYYSQLAPIHEFLVFKIPVIGNIFRDPNKIIGILVFFYATFISLGAAYILKFRISVLRYFISIGFVVSMIMVLQPFYRNFLLNFYLPVDVPQEVTNINNNLNHDMGKALYLPQAEDRVNKSTKIASTVWNQNNLDRTVGKSIGDVYVYASRKNTTFQYEGNHPTIGYQYSYLQSLIDEGKTLNAHKIPNSFFANQMVYQTGYTSYAETEQFNLDLIGAQNHLEPKTSTDYLSIYDTPEPPRVADINHQLIATPGGIDKQILYSHIKSPSLYKNNIIYTAQAENSPDNIFGLDLLFDYKKFDDLWLSFVEDKFRLRPYSHINRALPFLGWAKTSIYKSEWSWFIKSLNIEHRDFSIGRNGGVIATFADSRLKVKSYDLKSIQGEFYTDLDELTQKENLFLYNEDKFIKLQIHPRVNEEGALVLGTISPGKPTKIWQVAKTRNIKVKGANPYSILVGLSGKNASSVHIKIHFFDNDRNEIGVTYLSRPDKRDNFDTTRFKTFFVSPRHAKEMSVSILSSRSPDRRIYWWVHQFDIDDLSEHNESNFVEFSHRVEKNTTYQVYSKVFKSPKGGSIKYKIGNSSVQSVDTTNEQKGVFQWVHLGKYLFNKREVNIKIENYSGFNALGDIIFLPEQEALRIKKRVLTKVKDSQRNTTFEAELDFNNTKPLQSYRNYPHLSGGRGIYIDKKVIRTDFDTDRDRQLKFTARGFNLNFKNLQGEIIDKKTNQVITRLTPEKVTALPSDPIYFVEKEEGIMIEELQALEYTVPLRDMTFKATSLPAGEYTLTLKNINPLPTMANTQSVRKLYTAIKPFDYKEDKVVREKECCQCQTVDPLVPESDAIEKRWTVYSKNTCQWHILQSRIIDIIPDNEYYVEYEFKNYNNIKPHQKIIFLDDNKNEIGKKYIAQNQLYQDGTWIYKNDLVAPPKGATKMMLLFMFKGVYLETSKTAVKNLRIINQTKLPLIDYVQMDEQNSEEKTTNKTIVTSLSEKNLMKKVIPLPSKLSNNASLTLNQPLHRVWSLKNHTDKNFVTNGVFHSTPIPAGAKSMSFHIPFAPFYWAGIVIHILFLLFSLFFTVFKKSPIKE